jgi:hypothetical protein
MPRVVAKEMGIHPVLHGRVRKGEVFEVPEGVTDSWFAPVEAAAPGKSSKVETKAKGAKTPAKGSDEPMTLRELGEQSPDPDADAQIA